MYEEEQTTPVVRTNIDISLDPTRKTFNVIIAIRNGTLGKKCTEGQRKGKEIEDSPSDDSVSVANGRSNYGSDKALYVIENRICRQDKWIIDSGCFYHMCSNKD